MQTRDIKWRLRYKIFILQGNLRTRDTLETIIYCIAKLHCFVVNLWRGCPLLEVLNVYTESVERVNFGTWSNISCR